MARRFLLTALLAATAAATGGAQVVPHPRAPRSVLAIHWGPPDFPVTPLVNEAIQEGLAGYEGAVDYFTEYLESDRVADADATAALSDYIRRKYRDRKFDVVFAVADPALRFVIKQRPQLFPDAAIVYSGVTRPLESQRVAGAGITAVMRGAAYADTLQLALDLQPSTEQVFIIATNRDPATITSVRAEFAPFAERVKLTYMPQNSVSALLSAVSALPARSLAVFVWFVPDNPGFAPSSESVVKQVAPAASVPVYGTNERYIGEGVVAGVVRGSRETGIRMGEMAREILSGKRAQDIPIEDARLIPTIDWRQVQRWGIDASRVPANSKIEFRNPTAWETYRVYIMGTIVVVGAQLVAIAGLLVQRERRRRAEAEVRNSETTIRNSYDRIRQMAGRLINAEEATRAAVARDLHDGVCQDLAAVVIAVDGLANASGRIEDPEVQLELRKIRSDSNGMFQSLRRLSHELHPQTLRYVGLATALKGHCAEVEKRHGVAVSFTANAEFRNLNVHVSVGLYRIAQEALRNALVHGESKRLSVSLVESGDAIELTVADDGKGFDLEAVRKSGGGLGLVSIEERAHDFGGKVEILSKLWQGTTVRVRVPATGKARSTDNERSTD